MSPTPTGDPTAPPKRQEQRRARTRARLLKAAHKLMSERGVTEVNITDITDEADLGTGTFYNYFSSRDEIFEVVAEESLNYVGDALDRSVSPLADPAEVWSGSLRHLVCYALTEQVWGWFFVRMGPTHPVLLRSFGHRARRDLERGRAEGRFQIDDVDLAVACTFGALIAAVQHGLTSPEDVAVHASRFAKAMLRMAGVAPEEATHIAELPLPELDIEAGFPYAS